MSNQVIVTSGVGQEYVSDELHVAERVIVLSRLATLLLVATATPTQLEVPEPMWLREWPFAVLLILTLRLCRRVKGEARPIVGTYAIENLPITESMSFTRVRLHLPRAESTIESLVQRAWGSSVGLLDAVAFGTDAAERNYQTAWPLPMTKVSSRVFPETLPRCERCFPGDADDIEHDSLVLFAAEFSTRKGIDVLMDAWESLPDRSRGSWRLLLVGFGPMTSAVESWAARRCDVVVAVSPPRDQVHASYRHAAVVVLPSVSVQGWKEQIGLSALEGVSHGCRVVITSDSGIAAAIERNKQGTVVPPGDRLALTKALLAEMRRADNTPKVLPDPTMRDSRYAMQAWFRDR